jgi:hypothetical protein
MSMARNNNVSAKSQGYQAASQKNLFDKRRRHFIASDCLKGTDNHPSSLLL